MLYYRVACQIGETQRWKWRSTSVTSLNTLLSVLRSYTAIPLERMLVFAATSKDHLDGMLQRKNNGFISTAVPARQMFQGPLLTSLDVARLELELQSDLDGYDEPYIFSVPVSVKEITRWIELRRYVQRGELVS